MLRSTTLKATALTLAVLGSIITAVHVQAETKDSGKGAAQLLVLKDNMTISDCEARGIGDNVLFIYSRYCPHCKTAMPIVEGIVTEQKTGSRYLPIDVTTEEGRALMKGYGITVQYVPTLVKGCIAHVGSKKKAEYEKILSAKSK
jgi:thiol-disulfide isomerase/thioredoxin